MFSAMQRPAADLSDVAFATAYAEHQELRRALTLSFETAATSFAACAKRGEDKAPWRVLDAGFGRRADGAWIQGPVDSFKLFCSATLFAAIAHREGHADLKRSALSVLQHFTGDVVYSSKGEGSSGHYSDGEVRNVLKGHDDVTLKLAGVTDWQKIVAGTDHSEL